MMFLTIFIASCGSGEKSSGVQRASVNPTVPEVPRTCSNLVASMEICAREGRAGERFRMEDVKSWIREDCERLGKENPGRQARLLECAQADCTRMEECLAGFLRERGK